MDKPLTYRTLSDLIFEFEDSYKKYLHSVKKVKIGLYVPHEPHSFQPIEWKQLVLNVSKMMRTEVRKELEKFARDMRMKVGLCAWAVDSEVGVPSVPPAEVGLAPCQQTDPGLRLRWYQVGCGCAYIYLGGSPTGFGVFSSPYSFFFLVQRFPLQPGKHLNPYSSLAIKELLPSLLFSPTLEEGGWEELVCLGLVGWVAWLQVGISALCT